MPYARFLIPCRWQHEDRVRQEIKKKKTLVVGGLFGGTEVGG